MSRSIIPPNNITVSVSGREISPCNDNIVVEVHGSGCFVTTTARTEGFTRIVEAQLYVSHYFERLAALNAGERA